MLAPISQEAGDPLTDGRGNREVGEFGGEDSRDDSIERRAEIHKQDPLHWSHSDPGVAECSATPCSLHHPLTYLPCRQIAVGPAGDREMDFRWASNRRSKHFIATEVSATGL